MDTWRLRIIDEEDRDYEDYTDDHDPALVALAHEHGFAEVPIEYLSPPPAADDAGP